MLLVAFLVATVVVLVPNGFKIMMTTLLAASLVLFFMFVLAYEYNVGTKNPILKYLVAQSARNDLTADETYEKGACVSAGIFFSIPAIYHLAQNM